MIESKGGESIKGMTIKDTELIEFGVPGVRGAPHHRPCERAVLPRARRRARQVTDVNPRFGGGFPLPTAAGSRYPELALALANGEQPEPRLGDFREGVVMTRFFSQVILEERGRRARAGAGGGGAGRGVRRLAALLAGSGAARGCGSQREAGTTSASQPTVAPATRRPLRDVAAPRRTRRCR